MEDRRPDSSSAKTLGSLNHVNAVRKSWPHHASAPARPPAEQRQAEVGKSAYTGNKIATPPKGALFVATPAERQALVDEFLGLVGRIQRLASPPDPIGLSSQNQQALIRWRNIYQEEIEESLSRQAQLTDRLRQGGVKSASLRVWIDDARTLLRPVPNM